MVRSGYGLGTARVGGITSGLLKRYLWQMFSGHAELLWACFQDQWAGSGLQYHVKKSIFAHKRASVSIHKDGQQMTQAGSCFLPHIISG
ncbi:MAG: glutathionylspermidine synthase family protein [Gammaproteobacteria bacterium]|nr:glutathionylspermidine synthase family protein [Gammaproteobacteria bacterium]